MTQLFRKRSIGYVILILFLGSIVGTVLGKLVALILPDGSVVEKFFLISPEWGIQPFTINAGLFKVTFGLEFELNVIGIIGIAFAGYLLKYYLGR